MEYARAAAAAAQRGDQEAADYFRSKSAEGYRAEAPSATEGMSGLDKFRAGMGQGMTNIVRQAGNILGVKSDEELQDAAGLDRALLDTGAGRAGAIAGEMALTAPVGGLVASGARGVGAGLIRAGMAEGAAQGALTGGPGNRLGGAAQGAALGAALPGAVRVAQRLSRPVAATGEARRLVEAGVRLTPGELRPEGVLNQMEQALQSAPYFGAKLRGNRDRSMIDFQRAVAEATQAPGAAPIPRSVRDVNEMASRVNRGYEQGYEQALGGYNALEPRIVGPHLPNYPGAQSMPLHGGSWGAGAVEDAITGMPSGGRLVKPQMRTDIAEAARGELSALPRSNVTGRQLQGVRSNIRSMARDTDVPGERALLRAGEQRVTDALESQLTPEDAAALRALDQRYGLFKTLQDVTKRGGDQPGGWTPAQLSQSVRASTDLGEYARGGGGPLRTLSKAGRKVFEQRSMPTGERQVTLGFLGRAGLPIAAGLSHGLSKVPTKVLVGNTGPQKALAAALRKARRDYASDAQALEALGTAGLIQAYGE
jgi:hypothetical protein